MSAGRAMVWGKRITVTARRPRTCLVVYCLQSSIEKSFVRGSSLPVNTMIGQSNSSLKSFARLPCSQ